MAGKMFPLLPSVKLHSDSTLSMSFMKAFATAKLTATHNDVLVSDLKCHAPLSATRVNYAQICLLNLRTGVRSKRTSSNQRRSKSQRTTTTRNEA